MKFINFISFRFISYILLGIAILLEFIYLYKDIFFWMKKAWLGYPPDKFGMFVPLIFSCMLLLRIIKSKGMAINSDIRGLLFILFGVTTFFIGYVSDINIIQAASIVFIGFGILFFMLGSEWARDTLFSFIFLFFMLPTCSFLLESASGVYLRNMISTMSGFALDIIGGHWGIGNGILYLNDIDLPIQYFRDSISSPLALLIITFIAAEIIFKKNRNKLIFILLYWAPVFVLAHCVFTTAMGTAFEHDYYSVSEAIWSGRRWIPAVVFITILMVVAIMVRILRVRDPKFSGVDIGRSVDG